MILLERKVPSNFNLFLFSDEHIGNRSFSWDGWNKLVDMMLSPYDGLPARVNFGVDGGDFAESIYLDDPRFEPEFHVLPDGKEVKIPSAFKQVEEGVQMRLPIADRLVTVLEGNHPMKLWRIGNMTQELCKRLNVKYGTWSCKITWKDKHGKPLFKSYHTHGKKLIKSGAKDPKQRINNMRLSLKEHLRYKFADTMLMCKSHTHLLLVCKPESELYLTDDGAKIKQNYTSVNQTDKFIHSDQRFYVNTGSFLRLYGVMGASSYAEIAEYDPIQIGFAIAKIRDRKLIDVDEVPL